MCAQKLKLKTYSKSGKKHKQVTTLLKAKFSQANKNRFRHIPTTSNRKDLLLYLN